MKKKTRIRKALKRLDRRVENGTASLEDECLRGFGGTWNRAWFRKVGRHWDTSKNSLMMDDFQYANHCFRDWMPQLIHNGRKP